MIFSLSKEAQEPALVLRQRAIHIRGFRNLILLLSTRVLRFVFRVRCTFQSYLPA